MSALICLDVGEKRIGVATGNTTIRVAQPHSTVDVNGSELEQIKAIIDEYTSELIIIGLPRNMDGAETAQTHTVREFAHVLERATGLPIAFQDESLTSVEAEQRLEEAGQPYTKGDVDKHAAAIILQDYLEEHT